MKITPILWTYDIAKDGLCPIKIRISEGDASPKYVPKHGIARIKKGDWDKKKHRVKEDHPNSKEINKRIIDLLHEAELDHLKSPVAKSVADIADTIASEGDLYYYLQKSIDASRARNSHHRADTDESRLNIFKMWRKKWPVKEVTLESIKSLEKYLQGKGNKPNTIADKMAWIRTIVNDLGISPNPFDKYEISMQPTDPKALYDDDLDKLRAYRVPGHLKQMKRAKYFWLAAYNAAGMRWGDLCRLKRKNLVGDRIRYTMNKNGRLMNIPQSTEFKKIVKMYLPAGDDPEDYVFPILDQRMTDLQTIARRIKNANRNYNRSLGYLAKRAGMNQRPRFHDGRHTFADKIETTAETKELLGHGSERTSERYRQQLHVGKHDDAFAKALRSKKK